MRLAPAKPAAANSIWSAICQMRSPLRSLDRPQKNIAAMLAVLEAPREIPSSGSNSPSPAQSAAAKKPCRNLPTTVRNRQGRVSIPASRTGAARSPSNVADSASPILPTTCAAWSGSIGTRNRVTAKSRRLASLRSARCAAQTNANSPLNPSNTPLNMRFLEASI